MQYKQLRMKRVRFRVLHDVLFKVIKLFIRINLHLDFHFDFALNHHCLLNSQSVYAQSVILGSSTQLAVREIKTIHVKDSEFK